MILVPLFDLKFPKRACARWCRNFKSAALAMAGENLRVTTCRWERPGRARAWPAASPTAPAAGPCGAPRASPATPGARTRRGKARGAARSGESTRPAVRGRAPAACSRRGRAARRLPYGQQSAAEGGRCPWPVLLEACELMDERAEATVADIERIAEASAAELRMRHGQRAGREPARQPQSAAEQL